MRARCCLTPKTTTPEAAAEATETAAESADAATKSSAAKAPATEAVASEITRDALVPAFAGEAVVVQPAHLVREISGTSAADLAPAIVTMLVHVAVVPGVKIAVHVRHAAMAKGSGIGVVVEPACALDIALAAGRAERARARGSFGSGAGCAGVLRDLTGAGVHRGAPALGACLAGVGIGRRRAFTGTHPPGLRVVFDALRTFCSFSS